MDPVIRVRRGAQTGTDDHGSPVYGATVETSLPEAAFAPGRTFEPVEAGRDAIVTQPAVYWFRLWPDVAATDQLRVRGRLYDVIGSPSDWRSGFGTDLGGLVVALQEVDG